MLGKVVNLRGAAGAVYDKYELWVLKGESHLRLKQAKAAADAFAAAARATDDESQAATARATRRLLAEAKSFRITRRGPAPKAGDGDGDGDRVAPVRSADLLDPAQRRDALQILYDDAMAAAKPKLDAARRARTLPAIAEGLKLAESLEDLELAATGGRADLRELRTGLADRAVTLMTKELERMERDVSGIREDAEKLVEHRRRQVNTTPTGFAGSSETVRYKRRGLVGDDAEDLRTVMETCAGIIDAAESLDKAGFGESGGVENVIDRAKDVGEAAERVLNGRYGAAD